MVQIIAHTLVTAGHDILILKRNQFERGRPNVDASYWDFPGGCALANELPQVAAKRECWEETGLKVQTERVIWEDSTFDKAKNQVYTRLVYSAQAFVTRPTVNLDLTEHMAFLWMKPELILTNIRIVSYLKPILTRLV